MKKFRCASCGDQQTALAAEVGHYCLSNIDARTKQPKYTLYQALPLDAPGLHPVNARQSRRGLAPVVPVSKTKRSTKRGK